MAVRCLRGAGVWIPGRSRAAGWTVRFRHVERPDASRAVSLGRGADRLMDRHGAAGSPGSQSRAIVQDLYQKISPLHRGLYTLLRRGRY